MKKRWLVVGALAVSLVVPGFALADGFSSPAEIISALKGVPAAEVTAERAEEKTYGQIAQKNGVLDEFQQEMLEYKYSIIDQRVKDGVISQEDADALKQALADRVAACDGTPDPDRERLGCGLRLGAGQGKGAGSGQGLGLGQGKGLGGGLGCRWSAVQ